MLRVENCRKVYDEQTVLEHCSYQRQKEEFRKAVIRCQETGISEDDAQKIVREVYEGKQG